jgi:hypothetical protein
MLPNLLSRDSLVGHMSESINISVRHGDKLHENWVFCGVGELIETMESDYPVSLLLSIYNAKCHRQAELKILSCQFCEVCLYVCLTLSHLLLSAFFLRFTQWNLKPLTGANDCVVLTCREATTQLLFLLCLAAHPTSVTIRIAILSRPLI